MEVGSGRPVLATSAQAFVAYCHSSPVVDIGPLACTGFSTTVRTMPVRGSIVTRALPADAARTSKAPRR